MAALRRAGGDVVCTVLTMPAVISRLGFCHGLSDAFITF